MAQMKILDSLNEHLQLELQAWYEYSGMALWLEMNDLPGCAAFMKVQADEELAHAQKIIHHLLDRDHMPMLPPIDAPAMEYENVRTLFERVLAAEQTVTASIDQVYRVAEAEDDQPARLLLTWFVTEQVEEEAAARAVLGRIRLAGDTGPGLLMIDQELGRRQPESDSE
jgi:ferritin